LSVFHESIIADSWKFSTRHSRLDGGHDASAVTLKFERIDSGYQRLLFASAHSLSDHRSTLQCSLPNQLVYINNYQNYKTEN
jgi:hypothetical protein